MFFLFSKYIFNRFCLTQIFASIFIPQRFPFIDPLSNGFPLSPSLPTAIQATRHKMADDEQFSLCWNNFNTNLSAGFHESLIRGDLVDVTLAAEGQLVKAHRLILSVCSPYFRKMFTQMPANQHAFSK